MRKHGLKYAPSDYMDWDRIKRESLGPDGKLDPVRFTAVINEEERKARAKVAELEERDRKNHEAIEARKRLPKVNPLHSGTVDLTPRYRKSESAPWG